MVKRFVVVCAVLLSCVANAQNFAGTWYGLLDVGVAKLNLSFHIKDSAGVLFTVLDSPDQNAFGFTTDTTIVRNDSVFVIAPKMHISFKGRFMDGAIKGEFTQGAIFPLNLSRERPALAKKEKPQTPQKPFSYIVEEVLFYNKEKTIRYGATITYPQIDSTVRLAKAPIYPAVILITGSGAQDRDETLLGHKPFAVIADHLTKQGYTVLRVDDRGVGQTTGDFSKSSSVNFAEDVKVAIQYLKTLPYINIKKIGLLGHSEGGLVAPMVAATSKEVAFIISLAGLGVPGKQLLVKQNVDIFKSAGVPGDVARKYGEYFSELIDISLAAKDSAIAVEQGKLAFNTWRQQVSDSTIAALTGVSDEKSLNKFVSGLVSNFQTPWLRFFLTANPDHYWSKVNVPVLAINGNKDIQVAAADNIRAIENSLKKANNKKVSTKILPGLNHLFQTCSTCNINEYGSLEETIAPTALQTVSDWLLKNIGL